MTEVYRRKPPPPDWPRPISIVTRDIDISSGLLQTPYCPRNLVTTEFYISGTEPTRDCDKHGPYANPGLTPVDTFSTIPTSPPPSGAYPQQVRPTAPVIQPGYEPVPSGRRVPTVFDTTRRNLPPGDTIRPNLDRRDTTRANPVRRDTTRANPVRRDTTRANPVTRDTSRAGTSPPPPPPDTPR
jgi:hypothetical protein